MNPSFKRRKVRANNIDFEVAETGDGPLVLCLHGFPDTADSFREQMPALAQAGFHAVAPFMRGYAPSGTAPDGRYDVAALAEDAVALVGALGYHDAVIFGHDWGAVAAYFAALIAPQKIKKLITAAVPYGSQFSAALVGNYAQQKRSWYMFFFQQPLADLAVRHNDFAYLEGLWRDWSPGWKWTADDIRSLKECFRATGTLEAALGYYRATIGPMLKDPAQAQAMSAPINVPALMIQGRDDGCIGIELLEGMAANFPKGLRTEIIAGAGHFVHREKPAEVNRLILDFLKS